MVRENQSLLNKFVVLVTSPLSSQDESSVKKGCDQSQHEGDANLKNPTTPFLQMESKSTFD